MSIPEIVTGDDVVLLHQLTKYDKTLKKQVEFNIPNTAIVNSRIISIDHDENYSSAVVQSNSTSGSDWATSLVAVVFSDEVTSEVLTTGAIWKRGKTPAKLETQVDDNGKLTFFAKIIMVKGSI